MAAKLDVYLETGTKRVFASALDWPGWSRSGRDADAALEALIACAPRYSVVLRRRVQGFPPPRDAGGLRVVERVKGNPTTDFGAPGIPAKTDARPLGSPEAERLLSVLRACWAAVDRAAAEAEGVALTKGPRGGGRDLDPILRHICDAEAEYVGRIGVKVRLPQDTDLSVRVRAARSAVLDTARSRVRGDPLPENPRRRAPLWPVRYFVRRTAWHALDHAWEIEDRSAPGR